MALDAAGNVYVTGASSSNVFMITAAGAITEIIDNTGDGAGNTLLSCFDVELDAAGNAYVVGSNSANVFRIEFASLTGDVAQISVSAGGVQTLSLDAGLPNAGAIHFLLGSLSGTSPGQTFGAADLPLNFDGYFLFTLVNPNSPPLSNSVGILDGQGQGTTLFTVPPGTSGTLAGLVLNHAYGLLGSPFVSNPVQLTLTP